MDTSDLGPTDGFSLLPITLSCSGVYRAIMMSNQEWSGGKQQLIHSPSVMPTARPEKSLFERNQHVVGCKSSGLFKKPSGLQKNFMVIAATQQMLYQGCSED